MPLMKYYNGSSFIPLDSANLYLIQPTTSGNAAGIVEKEAIDSATAVVVGDVLYLSSTGYKKAQANAAATVPALAMALEAGTGGTRKVLKQGEVKKTGWSFTKGQLIYLDITTAGNITTTRPSATGNQVQILGYATGTDTFFFNPSLVTAEI